MISYEGQKADPILQEFRRRAVSNTLATESTASHDNNSASTSGSPTVREQILRRFTSAKISPIDLPSFVPIDTLTTLISIKIVSRALAEVGRRDVSSGQCANIYNTLPRVFATLLLMGNVEAILDFEARNFTDSLFPLVRADISPEHRGIQLADWYSTIRPLFERSGDGIHPVSRCFQDPLLWTPDKFEQFYKSQWLFSAPIFGPEKFEYALDPQSPLPLTALTPHRTSAFLGSQVYMASIHPAHLLWQNTVRAYIFTFIH